MIRLIKSSFYNESDTKKKLSDFILSSDIFSMNKECERFENNFAKKQNRKKAVFVNSGSSANLILIQSLLNLGRLKKGDNVGVSALTWATNVHPLIQLGLNPVAIDCNLDTLNVSVDILKKNIKNLDALFLTNVLGFCDDIKGIQDLCLKNNVVFLEDNCESLGSVVGGQLLGNFGLASTFSFFVGHHMSTIEGGMICADDEELSDMLIMVRAHGWDRNLSSEKQQVLRKKHEIDDFFAKYTFYDLAYNARPTEINGFLGNIQLGYWDEIVQKRVDNFKTFMQAIEGNDDFLLSNVKHMDIISNFAMPVICKNKEVFQKYKNKFENNNVEIRPVIAGNMSRQPFYKKYINNMQECQNSDFIHQNGFYFPNNPELTNDEIKLLTELLMK